MTATGSLPQNHLRHAGNDIQNFLPGVVDADDERLEAAFGR